jgi:hypothetical protein
MDKNVFDIVEPAYEPLTEQDELKILAAVKEKTGGANDTVGIDGTGGADAAETSEDGIALGRRRASKGRTGSAKPATRSGRGRHGRRIAVIAVAAVLAFGAVVFASTSIDPNSPLLAMFGIDGTNEQQLSEHETQLIQSSGTLIGKTVEKNGVKIHVKEAIGDKDTVYLLVDVTPPKDAVEPDAEYQFERVSLKEATPSLLGSATTTFSSSSTSSRLSEDGTFPFIISATANNGVQGKKFTLELQNLQRVLETNPGDEGIEGGAAHVGADESSGFDNLPLTVDETSGTDTLTETYGVEIDDNGETIEYKMTTDEDGNIIDYVSGPAVDGNMDGNLNMTSGEEENPFEIVIEGDWKVTFKLNHVDNSKFLNIDEKIDIDGDSYHLTDVRISPLSLSYDIDEGKAADDASLIELDKLEELPVIIKMKDGAEYNLDEYQSGSSLISYNTTCTASIQFRKVIDPTQVESITFGTKEIKL